jgi:hypothetical protein
MLGKLFVRTRTRPSSSQHRSSVRKATANGSARLKLEELESRLVPSGVNLNTHNDPVNHIVAYEIELVGTGNSVSISRFWDPILGGYIKVTGLNGTLLTNYAHSAGENYNPTTGPFFTWSDASYGEIWIDGGEGGNTIDVNDIVRPLVVQSNAISTSQADQINLGNGTLSGIQASVTLLEKFGSLSVNINDQNDTTNQTVRLGGSSAQPDPISQFYYYPNPPASAQCGSITGANFPTIYYQTSNIDNLTLQVGPGTGTVQVANTFVSTTIINDGTATVDVGASGTTQGMQGALTVGNTVAHATKLLVNGTSGNDVFTFAPGAVQDAMSLNGVALAAAPASVNWIAFEGNGGSDSAYLNASSAGGNYFAASPGYAYLSGPGFTTYAVSCQVVVAIASPGQSATATLYGSVGNDTFVGTPTYAYLTTSGFTNQVDGFRVVTGVAGSGGTNRAYLYGGAGNNAFVGTPTYAYLTTSGFTNQVDGFQVVTGVAGSGGTNRAYLYGGAGNNAFVGTPSYAYLYGSGFWNQADGFQVAVGTAGPAGSSNVAYLYGSAGNDVFVGTPSYGYLYGGGFWNQANGFQQVEGVAGQGGKDLAYLFGSGSPQDVWVYGGSYAYLYDSGFWNQANGFTYYYSPFSGWV